MVIPAVHTLLPSVLLRLDSLGIEALILILEKVLICRYDLFIGPILLPSHVCFVCLLVCLFMCMLVNIKWIMPYMEGDHPVPSHIAIATTYLCGGAIVLVKHHHQFSRISRNVYFFFLKVLNSLSSERMGLSGRKQCSYYQERLNLMEAKIHSCGTTP